MFKSSTMFLFNRRHAIFFSRVLEDNPGSKLLGPTAIPTLPNDRKLEQSLSEWGEGVATKTSRTRLLSRLCPFAVAGVQGLSLRHASS